MLKKAVAHGRHVAAAPGLSADKQTNFEEYFKFLASKDARFCGQESAPIFANGDVTGCTNMNDWLMMLNDAGLSALNIIRPAKEELVAASQAETECRMYEVKFSRNVVDPKDKEPKGPGFYIFETFDQTKTATDAHTPNWKAYGAKTDDLFRNTNDWAWDKASGDLKAGPQFTASKMIKIVGGNYNKNNPVLEMPVDGAEMVYDCGSPEEVGTSDCVDKGSYPNPNPCSKLKACWFKDKALKVL